MNENAELEPRFIVTVTLDGDDYPPTASGVVSVQLEDELTKMQREGTIRAYTIERAVSEPWFESLREQASRGGRATDGGAAFTPVRDDQLLALLEIAAAARAFIGTTSVFRQQRVSRDAFTRLAVSVFWPEDSRAAGSQVKAGA